MGRDSDSDSRSRLTLSTNRRATWADSYIQRLVNHPIYFRFDFAYTEHGYIERKEHAMNAIALTIILIVRVLVPFTILITLGEWVQRREKNYWLRM